MRVSDRILTATSVPCQLPTHTRPIAPDPICSLMSRLSGAIFHSRRPSPLSSPPTARCCAESSNAPSRVNLGPLPAAGDCANWPAGNCANWPPNANRAAVSSAGRDSGWPDASTSSARRRAQTARSSS